MDQPTTHNPFRPDDRITIPALLFGILFSLFCLLPPGVSLAAAPASPLTPLSLQEAEELATTRDLPGQIRTAQAQRFLEEGKSAGQFADPQLTLGYENLPEMEEYRFGLRQEIPRPKSLALRQAQLDQLRGSELNRARLAGRAVLRETRHLWFELWLQGRTVAIIDHHVALLTELAAAEKDRYATGGLSQQELLLLQLEEQMARDRLLAAREREEVARADLARLVGDEPAGRPLPVVPDLQPLTPLSPPPPPPSLAELRRELADHPALLAADSAAVAAERGADLAGLLVPTSMVDLLYIRTSNEENRYGLMFSLPLPLWPEARQERRAAAGRQQARAAHLEREDLHRRLASDLAGAYRRFELFSQRLDLYQSDILPRSSLAREATLTAYRQGRDEFRTLLRAAVFELENELNALKLTAQLGQTRAVLLYYLEEGK